ncbi:MAG: hypothetical protein Q9221_004170 [Calogaya cf. arnoldii]
MYLTARSTALGRETEDLEQSDVDTRRLSKVATGPIFHGPAMSAVCLDERPRDRVFTLDRPLGRGCGGA